MLATLACPGGPRHSLWWAATQSLPIRHCSFIPWSQPVSLLGGAMRTKPCKINSGCQSERVGGRGPGGHLEGVLGSPGRVALVMAASGPVWCLRQRQALPEVFQLCLELLPFHCQLLSLGHQFLERKYQVKGPFKGILIYPHICLHSCLFTVVHGNIPSFFPSLVFTLCQE